MVVVIILTVRFKASPSEAQLAFLCSYHIAMQIDR